MKSTWTVLLIASPALRQRMELDEIARSFGCRIETADSVQTLQAGTKRCQLLLMELNAENHDEIIASLSSMQGSRPYEHLILFQKMPASRSIDPFWSCGLSSFVPFGDSLDVLYQALDHHFAHFSQIRSLDNQLREASDIAILSMSASSQLGEIIRFLEQSYQCKDYGELGALLNLTLERLGVAGCGLIETEKELVYFGAEERQDAWQRLMLEMRNRGRFVDIENRTITNFDSISVMARNMPEVGSEPYGRMKDMLFTLVEGAEARVKTLALERAVAISERAKSTFLRVMSHELRTPMNAILGFSNRLAAREPDTPITAREISAVNMIHENAERLMEMIEDLEDLSNIRVDAENARSRILVEDVLTETLRLTQARAEAKGIQFRKQFSEAGLQAELDGARLNQVVKKLCMNAVKFTQAGHIAVVVGSEYSQTNGEELIISVEDTGAGIPDDRISEVFQSFTRFYDDYSHHQQGTGLGLAVVKEFVADMGGTIALDSVLGKGTRFTLRFTQFVGQRQGDDVELF